MLLDWKRARPRAVSFRLGSSTCVSFGAIAELGARALRMPVLAWGVMGPISRALFRAPLASAAINYQPVAPSLTCADYAYVTHASTIGLSTRSCMLIVGQTRSCTAQPSHSTARLSLLSSCRDKLRYERSSHRNTICRTPRVST